MLESNAAIEFLEFKPAEIAAAVAIFVVGETKTIHTENAASALIQYVEKVMLQLLWQYLWNCVQSCSQKSRSRPIKI